MSSVNGVIFPTLYSHTQNTVSAADVNRYEVGAKLAWQEKKC